MSPIMGKIPAFLAALCFSFIVNKIWTFQNKNQEEWNIQQFLKFLFVSSIGLAISLVLMDIFTGSFALNYLIANLIISAIILVWNFTANSFWTFKTTDIHEMIYPILPETGPFEFETSIVIPTYNEQKRISKTLKSALEYFTKLGIDFEILVVDDGSCDTTQQIVTNILKNTHHRAIALDKNKGKGNAVRVGVLEAKGRYILFADADEATPFSEYQKLRNCMMQSHIAIGSRYKKKGTVQEFQPFYRIVISRLVNFISQIFLIEGISDTQCGFKMFRSSVGKKLFSMQRIYRFAFDMEFLMLAKHFEYRIVEIPVLWYDKKGSTVRFWRDSIQTIKDFFIIKFLMIFRLYKK